MEAPVGKMPIGAIEASVFLSDTGAETGADSSTSNLLLQPAQTVSSQARGCDTLSIL